MPRRRWWIRGLLILTCTGVSFFHGGNDGQKGMGLIMLILIGAAPTAYALNRTMPDSCHTGLHLSRRQRRQAVFAAHAGGGASPPMTPEQARKTVGDALRDKNAEPAGQVFAGLSVLSADIATQVKSYGAISHVPAAATPNLRNDMYLTSDAVRLLPKQGATFNAEENRDAEDLWRRPEEGHALHPALGEGLRRDRAGPRHHGGLEADRRDGGRADRQDPPDLCPGRVGRNGRGADHRRGGTLRPAGLHHPYPVQRGGRHDGGQRSGLQWSTVRSIALAWVITLPAAMALAGGLYFILRQFV